MSVYCCDPRGPVCVGCGDIDKGWDRLEARKEQRRLAYLERTEPCDCDLGGMGRRADCELHGEAS